MPRQSRRLQDGTKEFQRTNRALNQAAFEARDSKRPGAPTTKSGKKAANKAMKKGRKDAVAGKVDPNSDLKWQASQSKKPGSK